MAAFSVIKFLGIYTDTFRKKKKIKKKIVK